MPRLCSLLHALRVAALWLLITCVFWGSGAVSAPLAFGGAGQPCGASCPCDEEPHAGDAMHDEDEHESVAHVGGSSEGAVQAGEAPCDEGCPEGCPDCRCRPGVALAVLPLPAGPRGGGCLSARGTEPVGVWVTGERSSVFRPPRART